MNLTKTFELEKLRVNKENIQQQSKTRHAHAITFKGFVAELMVLVVRDVRAGRRARRSHFCPSAWRGNSA